MLLSIVGLFLVICGIGACIYSVVYTTTSARLLIIFCAFGLVTLVGLRIMFIGVTEHPSPELKLSYGGKELQKLLNGQEIPLGLHGHHEEFIREAQKYNLPKDVLQKIVDIGRYTIRFDTSGISPIIIQSTNN